MKLAIQKTGFVSLAVLCAIVLSGCQMTNWQQQPGYGAAGSFNQTIPESSLGEPTDLGGSSESFYTTPPPANVPHSTVRPVVPESSVPPQTHHVPSIRGPIRLGEPTTVPPTEFFQADKPATIPLPITKAPDKSVTPPTDRESLSAPAELAFPEDSVATTPLEFDREPFSPGPEFPLFEVTPTVSIAADFSVAAPEVFPLDEPTRIRLTVRNPTESRAEGWKLAFTLPESMQRVNLSEQDFAIDVPAINAGGEQAVSLTLLALAQGTQTFEVRLMSADKELAWREVTLRAEQQPLSVRLLGPETKPVNGRAEFTLRIENSSSEPVGPLTAAMEYDATLIPLEASEGAEQKPGKLEWQFPVLHPGEILFLQAEYSCGTTTENSCLSAVVAGDRSLPAITRRSCLSVKPPHGTLRLEVLDQNDLAPIGNEITALVRVTNLGLQPARSIKLAVEVNDAIEFQRYTLMQGEQTLPVGSRMVDGQLQFDPVRELNADETLEYRVVFKSLQTGDRTFRVHLTDDLHRQAIVAEEPFTITP